MRTARDLERRAFPAGFWHPNDGEGLAEVMRGSLDDLGLSGALLDDELIGMLVAIASGEAHLTDLDEDAIRRHQIGRAAGHVNRLLEERQSTQRLYAFAEDIPDWESDEPVWLLLTADERAQLLRDGVVRPPAGVERGYDPTTGT